MICDKAYFDGFGEDVFLETFISAPLPGFKRDALLVIPGGGYGCICSDREGEPIAHAFLPHGFNAFVLHYTVGKKARFPQPLIEASVAMHHIRTHAEEYGIDPERIFVVGFSAGGHLCASLGTLWHLPEVTEAAGIPYGSNKPTAVLPIYGAVAMDPELVYEGYIDLICGEKANRDRWSLDKQVDERTVPMYLAHTANDNVVDVRSSLRLASALAEHKIPFELHVFADGPHGIATSDRIAALANPACDNAHNANWIPLAAEWMKNLK